MLTAASAPPCCRNRVWGLKGVQGAQPCEGQSLAAAQSRCSKPLLRAAAQSCCSKLLRCRHHRPANQLHRALF